MGNPPWSFAISFVFLKTQMDKNKHQGELMEFLLYPLRSPINTRIEDISTLPCLHFWIFFPFQACSQNDKYIRICEDPHHYYFCGKNISCCELAICFDRMASQRMSKPWMEPDETQLSFQKKNCVVFFLSWSIIRCQKGWYLSKKINNEPLVSETVSCLGLRQQDFLFPDTARKSWAKKDTCWDPLGFRWNFEVFFMVTKCTNPMILFNLV